MKSILKVNPAIYFKGLEEIKSIELLENGAVLIHYTITDEFMKEHNLWSKDRQLQIDPNETTPVLQTLDFARPDTNETIYHNMKGSN